MRRTGDVRLDGASLVTKRIARKMMPRSLIAAVVAACIGSLGAVAKEPALKYTVIDVSYDSVRSTFDPCCSDGKVIHTDIRIVLYPDNTVEETTSELNPMSGHSFTYKSFKKPLGQGSQTQIWRIMPGNVILRGQDFPHNTRTEKIVLLPGNRCDFSIKHQLKKGFSDYTFPMWTLQWEHDSAFKSYNFTCSIHSQDSL
jgi:hypothetical protein